MFDQTYQLTRGGGRKGLATNTIAQIYKEDSLIRKTNHIFTKQRLNRRLINTAENRSGSTDIVAAK